MKYLKTILIFISLMLASCSTSRHIIDKEALDQAKVKTFHVGTIEISCSSLAQFPRPPFSKGREFQEAMLENIKFEELRKVLIDNYGLNIAPDDKLILKSSITNFIGLISESSGRCFYKENSNHDKNGDVINVVYNVGGTFAPLMPAKISMGYEVVVKSADKVLIEHIGQMETLELSFFNRSAWYDASQIIMNKPKMISEILLRDIQNISDQVYRPDR